MISFNIQANREDEFSFRLGKLTELVRQGLVDPQIGTLPKQAQLLTERCMRLTPPRNQEQGKKRVRYDMRKIFHPVIPGQFKNHRVSDLVIRSSFDGWMEFQKNCKSGPFFGTIPVVPDAELHKENRDRRGRAKKTNFVTLWKQRAALNRLTEAAQARIGWAKAGWMTAYRALGGTRAPAWVSRHANAPGTYTHGTEAGREFIDVRNKTGWGKYRFNSDAVVATALRSRAVAMKTYFEKMMGLAAAGKMTPFQVAQESATMTRGLDV